MNQDNIRDIAIGCVDEMVKENIIPDCTDTNDNTEWEVQDIIVSKICEQKYSMEHFDDSVCDLFSMYLGEGFVSSNNEQFFNDKDLVADFNYHLEGLKTLIQHTRGKV